MFYQLKIRVVIPYGKIKFPVPFWTLVYWVKTDHLVKNRLELN